MITQLLVGLWAVIATVFAFRTGHEQSVAGALTRIAALSLSGALCLIYLLALPFYPSGLAALLGIGILVLILIGRGDDAFRSEGKTMSDTTVTPQGLSLLLLAACAGSVNLLSITLLGGPQRDPDPQSGGGDLLLWLGRRRVVRRTAPVGRGVIARRSDWNRR